MPKHTARLWAVQDFAKGWSVAVGPRYISRAPVNHFNYYFLGGYTLWDAAVYCRRGRVEYSFNANSSNDFLVYPGRPLDVTGRVKFLF